MTEASDIQTDAVRQGRRYRAPLATYRVQLHAAFGFADARALIPYLDTLGISHLYCSPFFTAMPGSTHGYDILDHNQINPELGGLAGLYELGEALRARDMGLIADIVPNHVGIAQTKNPWWRDVLRHGRASRWANHFDINWEGQPHLNTGVVVYAILGQPFGAALEAGELRLALVDNDLALQYYEHALPLAPATYLDLVGLPPLDLRAEARDPAAFAEFATILAGLRGATTDDADLLLARFRAIVGSEPAFAAHITNRLAVVNGQVGDPASFDALDAILRRQHYRLAYWRISGEEINYRRFFDINELAAIRVEREDVFQETHRLLFELVRGGIVTGVRIDHIDGLYEPASYLDRLRQGLRDASAGLTGQELPIYVEKILEQDETLPPWPVAGTTGYDFLARVDGLLVDRTASQELTLTYERFIGEQTRFREMVYTMKRQIASNAFAGEINVLAAELYRLAQRDRLHRDLTLRSLRRALETLMAVFPVYRTYIVADRPGDADAAVITRAIAEALRREPLVPRDALRFLASVLLLQNRDLAPDGQERWLHFRRRFQQLSGPVMAKGFEDTALYRYNRLVSLNEVGNDPSTFGVPVQEVHRWLTERATDWPRALSASSTHDTKRGEDTRARLHVLSELPRVWRSEVRRWARLNRRFHTVLHGEPAPDPNTEYLIYQTLVGTWPANAAESIADDSYRTRLHDYLTKAMREMKAATNWISPDERYETACHAFLTAILQPVRPNAVPGFVTALDTFVRRIELAGALNSLTALTLKALAPGCPDFYQGTELWAFTLTDPDNRRPVDYQQRQALLHDLGDTPPASLTSPEMKLWLTHRLLGVRAAHAALVTGGDYEPLMATGERADHIFAFIRRQGSERLIVVVPRLTLRLTWASGAAVPLGSVWGDTSLAVPDDGTVWHDALTGQEFTAGGTLACAGLLRALPFAALTGTAAVD